MRRTLPILSFALALCAGALPAVAGGSLYDDGINPYAVATPVPAPIPVPVYEPEWYFRADFAAGFGPQPSVSAAGTPFAGGTIGVGSGSLSKDFEPSFVGGVGVGYIWGPAIRTDFTVDIHSIMQAKYNGALSYAGPNDLTFQDKTRFMSTILLFNAYYDFRTGTPFTPYLGGGVGFAVNQLTQEISAVDTGAAGNASASSRSTHIGFAGAAMAGVTWEINSFFALDINYRYLHIAGSDVNTPIYSDSSTISIGDLNEQQIRAGFRFYVN